MKYLYYAVVDNERLEYLEYEEEQTKEDFESNFGNYEESVEIYANCCNNGPFDLIYKNHEIKQSYF